MKYSNEELKKLWTNHEKRRAFIEMYKDWGVYITVPELNLTFYKYDLPDGAKLVVMEHMQKTHAPGKGKDPWYIRAKVYLQKEEYFMPHSSSDYEVCNYLKELKRSL